MAKDEERCSWCGRPSIGIMKNGNEPTRYFCKIHMPEKLKETMRRIKEHL
jgi:hypothetical protein